MRTQLTLVVLFLTSACGWSVSSARETGAQQTCRYYQKCNDIGQGETYATYDECLTKWRANWLNSLPTSTCEGKINNEAMDSCLKAIDNTQCNNAIDFLATVSKCGSGSICP